MFRKIAGFCTACAFLCAYAGCVIDGSESGTNATIETQTDSYVDLDNTQNNALGLIFGMPPVDDRLDYNSGDREDWRYIVVTEQGTMTIQLHVNDANSLEGGWNIIDAEGRTLHRESFSKNRSYYGPVQVPVKQGVYYFQGFATSGRSIYTIDANFASTEIPVVAPMPPQEPEEEEAAPETPKKRASSKKEKAAPSETPKPSKPKADAKSGTTITGQITIMTEKKDGAYEVTIKGVGKNNGIETGAIGTIEGTSIRIQMTQCFATSCRALIPEKANPKALKKSAKVIFKI